VRLSPAGELYRLERSDGKAVRHDTEPGTTRLQRTAVSPFSLLPIERLL
jgi:putative cardiolipin synthase